MASECVPVNPPIIVQLNNDKAYQSACELFVASQESNVFEEDNETFDCLSIDVARSYSKATYRRKIPDENTRISKSLSEVKLSGRPRKTDEWEGFASFGQRRQQTRAKAGTLEKTA